jgi:hypothetical protein
MTGGPDAHGRYPTHLATRSRGPRGPRPSAARGRRGRPPGGLRFAQPQARVGGSNVDLSLQELAAFDRDQEALLTYSASSGSPVLDLAGNPSIGGTAQAQPACPDEGSEPNDTQAPDSPAIGNPPAPERICAGNHDWFRVSPQGGSLNVLVNPGLALDTTVSIVKGDGTVVSTSTANDIGIQDVVGASGLSDSEYWLHVSGSGMQEDAYCVDPEYVDGDPACEDGDPNPN